MTLCFLPNHITSQTNAILKLTNQTNTGPHTDSFLGTPSLQQLPLHSSSFLKSCLPSDTDSCLFLGCRGTVWGWFSVICSVLCLVALLWAAGPHSNIVWEWSTVVYPPSFSFVLSPQIINLFNTGTVSYIISVPNQHQVDFWIAVPG